MLYGDIKIIYLKLLLNHTMMNLFGKHVKSVKKTKTVPKLIVW